MLSLFHEKIGFQIMRYYGPGPVFLPPPVLGPLLPPYRPGPLPMNPAAYSRIRHRSIYACWSLRKRSKTRISALDHNSKASWKYHDRELLRICSKELRYEVAWQREVIETPENRVMHKIHGIKSRRQRDAIYDLLRDENMELRRHYERLTWVIAGLHFQEEKYGRFGFRKTDTVAMLLVFRTQPSLYDSPSGTMGRPDRTRGSPSQGPIGPWVYPSSLEAERRRRERSQIISINDHHTHPVQPEPPDYYATAPLHPPPPPRSPSPFSPRRPKSRNRRREGEMPGYIDAVSPSSKHPDIPSDSKTGKGKYHARVSDYESSSDGGNDYKRRCHSASASDLRMDDDYQSAVPILTTALPRQIFPRQGPPPHRHEVPIQPPPRILRPPPPPQPNHQGAPISVHPAIPNHQGPSVPLIPRPGWDSARFAELDHETPPPEVDPRSPSFQRDLHIMLTDAIEKSKRYAEHARIQARQGQVPFHVLNSRSPEYQSDLNVRFNAQEQMRRYEEGHGLEVREREYPPPKPAHEQRHRRRSHLSHNIPVQDRSGEYSRDPRADSLESRYTRPEFDYKQRHNRIDRSERHLHHEERPREYPSRRTSIRVRSPWRERGRAYMAPSSTRLRESHTD